MTTIALIVVGIRILIHKAIHIQQADIIPDTQTKCNTFITNNISILSPTQAVLGGHRYVTNIAYQTGTTTAIVNYEDGHIAETMSIECSLENNEVKIGTITRLSSQ